MAGTPPTNSGYKRFRPGSMWQGRSAESRSFPLTAPYRARFFFPLPEHIHMQTSRMGGGSWNFCCRNGDSS